MEKEMYTNNLLVVRNAIICALHKVGFNIYEPKNKDLISSLFQTIVKIDVDKENDVYLNHLYKFKSFDKNLVLHKGEGFFGAVTFNTDFVYYFTKFKKDVELTKLYLKAMLELKVRSGFLVYNVLKDKYNFDISKTYKKFGDVEEMYDNLFYQYEKIGKFNSKLCIVKIKYNDFRESDFDEFKKFCKIDYEYDLDHVIIKARVKHNDVSMINSVTKISKHIKKKISLDVKFPV